ncbi:NAD(P)/FAD-dependent oxidoreductase [Jongsikchunia kroppenstedtii]|uniref:NAD(P)/FAD-dependent oxidoreductase n=1 Tax=Jongsikchunia kroppenstedtii TaxID=1121721 RepID=UPI00138AC435|nr:FAD-dependent oxidoreductase [Jongsikchunia kroppenstedtii]
MHEVVVVGAGYAGLPAAKRLARQVRKDEVRVTLVTAFPDFVERPRLHQMATGQEIVRVPLTRFLRGSAIDVVIGSVTGIDLDRRELTIVAEDGVTSRRYDTLVYALGSNIDTTTVPGIGEHARNLTGFAAAETAVTDLAALQESGGRVVVCGGGLTGIEIASEIAEHYSNIETLLVSHSQPGHWLSPKARNYLDRTLSRLEVDVIAGVRIREITANQLVLANDAAIDFDMCFWAGGFRVPTLAREAGLAVNSHDRALVDTTLRSISHPDVYVIGDAAAAAGSWGDELAMGCRSGGFTGPQVADIIAARLTGRDPNPFRFRYFHECISLGRKHGLVQFLNADESPKNRILTGHKAITYKNATLNGAKTLFKHPGPMFSRRRHLSERTIADTGQRQNAPARRS